MVTAVIPVKGKSERVAGKNLRLLGGETLLHRKVRILRECRHISEIVVNSDSEEMLEVAKKLGIKGVKRDPHFAEATTSMNDVIENVLMNSPGDHIYWAQVTSPLLTPETTDRAIQEYFSRLNEGYDSLASVQKLIAYLWQDSKPLNYSLERHPNSQTLRPYYMITFGVLLIQRELGVKYQYYVGRQPYLFELSPMESLDIDTEQNLYLAELYLQFQQARRQSRRQVGA